MRVYSDKAQMTSKCGKNKDYDANRRGVAWVMSCTTLSEYTRTAKWNLFVMACNVWRKTLRANTGA